MILICHCLYHRLKPQSGVRIALSRWERIVHSGRDLRAGTINITCTCRLYIMALPVVYSVTLKLLSTIKIFAFFGHSY